MKKKKVKYPMCRLFDNIYNQAMRGRLTQKKLMQLTAFYMWFDRDFHRIRSDHEELKRKFF